VGELVKAAGGDVRDQDEAVGGVAPDVVVDLVGDGAILISPSTSLIRRHRIPAC
jgi:hypothetical protein